MMLAALRRIPLAAAELREGVLARRLLRLRRGGPRARRRDRGAGRLRRDRAHRGPGAARLRRRACSSPTPTPTTPPPRPTGSAGRARRAAARVERGQPARAADRRDPRHDRRRELDLMPDGAVLVNTARGGLLDHAPWPRPCAPGGSAGWPSTCSTWSRRRTTGRCATRPTSSPPRTWPGATRQTAHRAAAIAAGEAGRFLRGEAVRHRPTTGGARGVTS